MVKINVLMAIAIKYDIYECALLLLTRFLYEQLRDLKENNLKNTAAINPQSWHYRG